MEVKVDEELTEAVLMETRKKIGVLPGFVAYYDSTGYSDKMNRLLLQKTYPNAFVITLSINSGYETYCTWALKEIVGDKQAMQNTDVKDASHDLLLDYDVITMDELEAGNNVA